MWQVASVLSFSSNPLSSTSTTTASHSSSRLPLLRISSVRIEEKPTNPSPPKPTTSKTPLISPRIKPTPPKITAKNGRRRTDPPSITTSIFSALNDVINNFVDPPLRSSVDPKYILADNFAPVDELPPTPCEVVQGNLPPCLDGAYIRNGPNPQYLPRGPYHLFDGDGMLHSIRISQGEATLCRRYVKTYKYETEVRAVRNATAAVAVAAVIAGPGVSRRRTRSKWESTSSTDVLRLMDSLNLPISLDIYSSLIKECTITCNSTTALELDSHLRHSRLKLTLPLVNRLLLMHVSCGHLDDARHLFDQTTVKKDFNSWAVIIIGYLESDQDEEAICLFLKMLQNSIPLSEFPTWLIACILRACISTMNMEVGKQVHRILLKLGCASNLPLSGSLINFYGKFRCLQSANLVFDQLSQPNTIVWTTKLVNNCREGCYEEVIRDFKEMVRAGVRRNSFTLSSVLKACAGMDDDGNCGRQVHVHAIKLGLESDDFVKCGLIDMYGKCGMVKDAKEVFEMISDERIATCWNAMLIGYAQNGLYVDAIKFLYRMKAAGVQVHVSLLNQIRIACGDGRVKMPLSPTVAASQQRPFGMGHGLSGSDIQLMESSLYPSTSSVSHSYSSSSLGQMMDSSSMGSFWPPHRSQMRLQSRRSQSRDDLISSLADSHIAKV